MSFADHFSGVSAAYAAFRPRYPDVLFDFLAQVAPAHEAAWDVGTGSGQAAVGLARHFTRVIATDASSSQIEHATPDPRVSYRVCPAEACDLNDRSIDLVTVAQALHWFDRPRFWAEVRRVLRPGGVIAVWTYVMLQIAPREFPFEEFAAPNVVIEQSVTLDEVAGYIRTWSATRRFVQQHGHDPVDGLVTELARVWGGAPQQPRLARWPVAMRVGRVE